ncbi:unnamed protein product [Darwinula stevensoni]|uniref:AB hydrolase-1 domain-containing protein n=1 Tax=Darwinula stevensoni TaxID=69355 RepID=A0A7R8ZXT1_9CRUS|nr:unnamed protein product [Darwinula stevensoni]CAG0880040.1 unnamed protein product [Darwinula stevensoni]
MTTSSNFSFLDDVIGFILADAGYDVWLGNVRGNTYGRHHVSLSPDDDQFWSFSFDEMGEFDLPAMLDKMAETTGHDKFHHVGHGMGTTLFWVMSDSRPEYRHHFLSTHAMAPLARVDHMSSPLLVVVPFVDQLQWLLDMLGLHEFLPSPAFLELLAAYVCGEDWELQDTCNLMFMLFGFDGDQLDDVSTNTSFRIENQMGGPSGSKGINLIWRHLVPASSGTTELEGMRRTRSDQKGGGVVLSLWTSFSSSSDSVSLLFDPIGENPEMYVVKLTPREGNLEHYGQEEPPEYDLSNVITPAFLYWGEDDCFADSEDVAWLADQLPCLIDSYRVSFDAWGHLDFLFGIDVKTLVYDRLLEMMTMFEP